MNLNLTGAPRLVLRIEISELQNDAHWNFAVEVLRAISHRAEASFIQGVGGIQKTTESAWAVRALESFHRPSTRGMFCAASRAISRNFSDYAESEEKASK